jgi:predicted nucleotidyltransferase
VVITRLGIQIPRDRIEASCRANGIRRLAVFGSVLREDFLSDSDVDVLVEFFPDVRVGLAVVRMQEELSAILNHELDLHTPGSLSQYFRDDVLCEVERLYVAA